MNDRFLKACRREPVDVTPVWFMRQAGRYMADYRALRQRYSLLEICRTPELAVAVTLQPVDVIDVFRRHDIGGFHKALWVIFVIILPFLGVLLYLIANHDGMRGACVVRLTCDGKELASKTFSVTQ